MVTESRLLYEKVILNDYCIGCGACAAVKDSPFKIKMNEFGNIVAYPDSNIDTSKAEVLSVCPFSGESKNEDEIVDELYKDVTQKDSKIGKYLANYAGYVKEGDFREKGSSGGMGKWLGYILLKEKKIDFLIQVESNKSGDSSKPLFDYRVISDLDDVVKGSKSSYYPVSLVEIFKVIRETEGRYAITGVPCFVKTLRLMSLRDEILRSRIKFTIGVICGGMKSANQAKMIGWQLGIEPKNLVAIDFRRKYDDKPTKYKIYQVWSDKDNVERFRDSFEIYGTEWGSGYFKPKACDYCDDVLAETADVSVGDAWLPQFVADPKGTNVVVVRNAEIFDLIEKNISNGNLELTKLSVEDVVISQSGGLRQRREGLSFRIAKKEEQKQWYPAKRVKPNEFPISGARKKIYKLREKISKQSHISFLHALQKNDLNVFFREMKPISRKYHTANYGNIIVRGFRKMRRLVSDKLFRKLNLWFGGGYQSLQVIRELEYFDKLQ